MRENPQIAEDVKVLLVPSFRIYIKGEKKKEIVNPTKEELAAWVAYFDKKTCG
jgi:hypothetical protein